MKKRTLVRLVASSCAVVLSCSLLHAGVLPGGSEGAVSYAKGKNSKAVATVSTATDPVVLTGAVIQGGNVVVSAQSPAPPAADDGLSHLLAQNVYENGALGKEVAQAGVGASANFSFPLAKNSANSNLFKKFTVCVKRGGVLVPVSSSRYLTNPEVTATHTAPRAVAGKKGLLPAAELLSGNSLKQLGVKQSIYNVLLGSICSQGGIPYTYNGKTYQFSSGMIAQLDYAFSRMNAQGIQVTAVLLANPGDPSIVHPLSRGGPAPYYAFNTAEPAGVEKLQAVASFLAQRYSGAHGRVDNWIVGNEVNARGDWHFMNTGDLGIFTGEYARAFRIFYNGIRSENANARVYMCIDQQWARASSPKYFSGVSFLSLFNDMMTAEGNIDWHVAMHPYNVPLYSPMAWNNGKYAQHSQATPYITIQNIEVLTDYLSQPRLLAPNGQVRSVLLSEVGYTSLQGEPLQAASLIYAYKQAEANSHVDGIIFSREMDAPSEIAQGLANGICGVGGAHKQSYAYFQFMDTPEAGTYINNASAIIGADLNSLLIRR